ncbi:lamin tail domain-containing protein [Balneolales bacterium ANBcel1]|nr:lamin tail domain-containing protein [Balneolales bacterium ANBcel1]
MTGKKTDSVPLLRFFFVKVAFAMFAGQGMAQPDQPVFSPDFSTPLSGSEWSGDLVDFRPDFAETPPLLRLDAPADQQASSIATLEKFEPVYWEWYIRQDFAPSNNNRTHVFLNASHPELDDDADGIALRTGENGTPKHFRLIEFASGAAVGELLSSDVEIESGTGYRIRVIRSPDNELHLYVASERTSTPLLQSATHTLNSPADMRAGHFGILTRFTSTRRDLTRYGDITIHNQLPEPGIRAVTVSDRMSRSPENNHQAATGLSVEMVRDDAIKAEVPRNSHLRANLPAAADELETVIEVVFNVPLSDPVNAADLFRLENGRIPDFVRCDHPQICTLEFRQPLASGTRTLSITSYMTIYNQFSEPEERSFRIADHAFPGDIVINEFMYRPPEGIPPYVELFNHTGKLLNLRNWRLQRRPLSTEPERIITESDLFIEPGEKLVLTSDRQMLESGMQTRNVYEMERFPRLNVASADKLRLFSADDVLIDSLHYHPADWGGFEVALERRAPTIPGWLTVNWKESTHPQGGTPGFPNTAQPPSGPPSLVGVDYSDRDTISIHFDRVMKDPPSPLSIRLFLMSDAHDNAHIAAYKTVGAYQKLHSSSSSEQGTLPKNASKTGELEINALFAAANMIRLIPAQPLQHDTGYLLLIEAAADVFGNELWDVRFPFRYFTVETAVAGDVVINEVLYRAGMTVRFVELLNRSEKVFDVRHWRIGRSTGSPVPLFTEVPVFPVHLQPGELVVISEPDMPPLIAGVLHFSLPNFPPYSRTGDAITIHEPGELLIDSLFYHPSWGGNRDGVSLERINPDGATLDPSNWREHPDGHTAGIGNYHYNPAPDPPEAVYAELTTEGMVKVVFNRFIRNTGLHDVSLNGRNLTPVSSRRMQGEQRLQSSVRTVPYALSNIDSGTGAAAGTEDGSGPLLPAMASEYYFRPDAPVERKYKEVAIPAVMDAAGLVGTPHLIPLAFSPVGGDLVFNEIMFQPISDRYGVMPDQSEYVEFVNRSGLALQLYGIRIHDRTDKHGQVRSITPEGSRNTMLLPESYLVIYPDTSEELSHSRLGRAFSVSEDSESVFLRADRLTLGLPSGGDAVYLGFGDHPPVDSLVYRPHWHNPNLIDTRGISLERILPGGISGDDSNWTSSTHPDGGTPGFRNSVSVLETEPAASGITLSPNPFSPNGDGRDDHLIIHYALDDPDYLLRVRIFDRSGRLVRTLADGSSAGREGQLIWDGRTDDGIMNRVGLYIIHLKAQNRSTGNSLIFREIAVLARPL